MKLTTSLAGKIEILGHEGICLSKYKDSVGVWTIGAGATRTEIPNLADWPLSKKLTIEEVIVLFEKSLYKYELAIRDVLDVPATQEQFDALVSWCYNVGTGWPHKATVMRLINSGRATKQELYNALMMFKKPKEIIGRRTKEAKLLTGQGYQNKGQVSVFGVNAVGQPVYRNSQVIDAASLFEKDGSKKEEAEAGSEEVVKPTKTLIDVFKEIFTWKKY